jgi:cell division protein FtsW (lipid II flippase)
MSAGPDANVGAIAAPSGVGAPTSQRLHVRVPSFATWVEMILVAAALAAFWPAFQRAAFLASSGDGRFVERGLAVQGLPAPVLPRLCPALAAAAETTLHERVCASVSVGLLAAHPSAAQVPAIVREALVGTDRAFAAPVQVAAARIDALRAAAREGTGEVRAEGDAAAALEAGIQPYLDRYRLAGDADAGPAPLRCAAAALGLDDQGSGQAAAMPLRVPSPEAAVARANALLLLGAALDGSTAVRGAADALLPPVSGAHAAGCETEATADLAAAATLMRDARQGEGAGRKNAAMLALLHDAGAQWAAALALAYAFVLWSRAGPSVTLGGAGAALVAWAAFAWLGRVPRPLGGHEGFLPAGIEGALPGPPSTWVLGVAGVGLVLLVFAGVRRLGKGPHVVPVALAPSSRIGFPGLVVATGLGALLLLDLSARGTPSNRYLALYHQSHLWLGLTLFSMLLFLRRPFGRALAWTLAFAGEAGGRVARRVGASGAALLLIGTSLLAIAAFALVLANKRQFTSEVGRIWLIVGAAWFFFLRGGPLAERLAQSRGTLASFARYLWPMLYVVGMLVAAMVATHDMGPLLIAGYGSGGFLAAAVAAWWHQRTGRAASAFGLAVLLFCAWIALVTSALFALGTVDDVTAQRLESLAAPLASVNDQLALVRWFQHAAPLDGYGLGAAPWCGQAPGLRCAGVPAQIHSDYTFTALVGLGGMLTAWATAIGVAFWLHRLVRHHGKVTRGEPRLVAGAGSVGADAQALLSWLAVAWVVMASCQLAVTVAGNLAVLPLTGVTFPFVSFGMTSGVLNLAFLALCLHVDVPLASADPGEAVHG